MPKTRKTTKPAAKKAATKSKPKTKPRAPKVVLPPIPPDPKRYKKDWYVLAVMPMKEYSIRNKLRRTIKINDQHRLKVGRMMIPTESTLDLRNGKRVSLKRNKFVGYIVVQCFYDSELYHLFMSVPGVAGFLPHYDSDLLEKQPGYRTHGIVALPPPPTALEEDEVKLLLMREETPQRDRPRGVVLPFEIGDPVKITAGAFEHSTGTIKEITPAGRKTTVKVTTKFLGQSVDVDVLYHELEKE